MKRRIVKQAEQFDGFVDGEWVGEHMPGQQHPEGVLAWQIKDLIPSDHFWLEPEKEEEYNWGTGEYETTYSPTEYKPPDPEDMRATPPSGSWYHVSQQMINVGARIVPAGAESPDSSFYEEIVEEHGLTTRQNYVWIAQNLGAAFFWSWSLNCPYIYKVHPSERPQPWNFDGKNGYVCATAKVEQILSTDGYRGMGIGFNDFEDYVTSAAPGGVLPYQSPVVWVHGERNLAARGGLRGAVRSFESGQGALSEPQGELRIRQDPASEGGDPSPRHSRVWLPDSQPLEEQPDQGRQGLGSRAAIVRRSPTSGHGREALARQRTDQQHPGKFELEYPISEHVRQARSRYGPRGQQDALQAQSPLGDAEFIGATLEGTRAPGVSFLYEGQGGSFVQETPQIGVCAASGREIQPNHVLGAEPGGRLPYEVSDYGYVWFYSEDGLGYVATTRDGTTDLIVTPGSAGVDWVAVDDQGVVERGNFSGMVQDLDGILYRADRLLSEFDESPVVPPKNFGYDDQYTESPKVWPDTLFSGSNCY